MIEISNLRIEPQSNGETRLVVDISSDFQRDDQESTIWISVKNEYAYMLTEEVYDAFLLLPVAMSMHYRSDLHLCGKVSKTLYRNVVDYVQTILCEFSNQFSMTNVTVDGFRELEGNHTVNGTGISCGVDCLQTIYKYLVQETDPEYKLTHLFMINAGWHGEYDHPGTVELFRKRCEQNGKAAAAMGLPIVEVDTNLHAFVPELDDRISYFYLYTVILALEKEVGKYYFSSSGSYLEVIECGDESLDYDFDGFGGAFVVPLLHNRAIDVIYDGGQYTRVQKTALIADWPIAQKYLNVCCRHSYDPGADETNCSCCGKCKRTLMALDGLDKLDEFSEVFDIPMYQKYRKAYIREVVLSRDEGFQKQLCTLFKERGKHLPPYLPLVILKKTVWTMLLPYWVVRRIYRIIRRRMKNAE